MATDLTGGGWVGAADTGGGGSVDHGLLEFLGDPAGHGINGIVIDGLVSWINIVQDGTTENVWKEQAESHYDEKEVTEAKDALWKACGANIGEALTVQRKGGIKTKMEIDDIHKGVRKLKSEANLPLILASSGMMAKVPSLGGISDKTSMGDMVSKVKELEDCMGAFMKKQTEQIKELTEIVTVQACQSQSKHLPTVINSLKDQVCPETPRSKKEDWRLNKPAMNHMHLLLSRWIQINLRSLIMLLMQPQLLVGLLLYRSQELGKIQFLSMVKLLLVEMMLRRSLLLMLSLWQLGSPGMPLVSS